MDDVQTAAPDAAEESVPAQSLVHDAPPAHSRAAHRVLGFCTACKGREWWEEVHAWRVRENEQHDQAPTPDRVLAPSREGEVHRGRR
ncbi:hypothetical protein [Streptomyces arboris]|uniref:hypothetical protein n=1 Tax=Streptomyces arboris TaxID=2600619 RepID=UPI003BF484B9